MLVLAELIFRFHFFLSLIVQSVPTVIVSPRPTCLKPILLVTLVQ